ncbi:MAG: GspE/PulE family protein [Candidatus Omnitrophota bacterium]
MPIASLYQDEIQLEKIIQLQKKFNFQILDLAKYSIPSELFWFIPEEMARIYKLIPVARLGQILTLAMSNPFDISAIDTVKQVSGFEVDIILSTLTQIDTAIDEYYSKIKFTTSVEINEDDLLKQETYKEAEPQKQSEEEIKELEEISKGKEIISMVNKIITQAVRRRASDIHIEPYLQVLRIRYRIDGVLHECKPEIEKKYEAALTARFKIMSRLDITQRRLPQDGRISLKIEGRDIDLRVSVLPLSTGEKIVLRILEKGELKIDLEKLGFSEFGLEAFKKSIKRPNGMIIITGPTGSGKSTTLYALLSQLNTIDRNITTVEDPVEYQMRGITQIQAKAEINLTFANILRAILRQNPDIVMVGEMRDFETVDIAVKAALTGHLMLSTLHTNDAPTAIVRLMNMGIESFLISSTLTLIAAQRLCRRLCLSCKEPYEMPLTNLVGLPPDFKEEKAVFYRAKGCLECSHTGYFGRVAVVESLLIDDKLRQMILKKQSAAQIREYARSQGMKTLREDAVKKCLSGEISLEEALRVTPEG